MMLFFSLEKKNFQNLWNPQQRFRKCLKLRCWLTPKRRKSGKSDRWQQQITRHLLERTHKNDAKRPRKLITWNVFNHARPLRTKCYLITIEAAIGNPYFSYLKWQSPHNLSLWASAASLGAFEFARTHLINVKCRYMMWKGLFWTFICCFLRPSLWLFTCTQAPALMNLRLIANCAQPKLGQVWHSSSMIVSCELGR